MGEVSRFRELEERIGYSFRDWTLLRTAMTHSSFANELSHHKPNVMSNERLEFLGDAVLELVTSEFIYSNHKQMPEGKLSKLRASIVCEPSLAICARDMELGKYLSLGRGEDATGGRNRESILSDAFEALIGAIYLDGGLEAAKAHVHRFVLNNLEERQLFHDSKTILQELAQKYFHCGPVYAVEKEEGPAHNRHFTVSVRVGEDIVTFGDGSTKKNAEQKAAFSAIQKIREQNGGEDVSKEH